MQIERLYSHPLERGDIYVYLMVWQRGGALLSDTCYPTDISENNKIYMKKERYICHCGFPYRRIYSVEDCGK